MARLVFFSADWCPHCHAMQPEWDRLCATTSSVDFVQIESADITEDMDIHMFPTIMLFTLGEDGREKKVQYSGPRTHESMRDFVKKEMTPHPAKKVKKKAMSPLKKDTPRTKLTRKKRRPVRKSSRKKSAASSPGSRKSKK